MKNIAKFIDHTALKPTVTIDEIIRLCEQALEHEFAAVCVPPSFVKLAEEITSESKVKVATVVGFPLGYSSIASKVFESINAMQHGADEIDMVWNTSAFKSGQFSRLQRELDLVTSAVHEKGKIIKIIVETAYLNASELERACTLCTEAGVDYVKTSTGFAHSGTNLEDIVLMRRLLPEHIKIKASGGIKTKDFALELINAGADRLGTSSALDLIL